jgi:iron complex outermembrane recepter protein
MLQLVKLIYGYLSSVKIISWINCVPFIFLLLFYSASLAQDGTIRGVVKDGETGLQLATISIAKKTALTNQAGEFSVTIGPGTYTLLITHVGYKRIEQRIVLKPGETQSLQFNLTRDELLDVVVLGSRSLIQRSKMNSPVPVDVVHQSQFPTGEINITRQLANIVPSFNAAPQTFGPAATRNPARLRGLGSDEILVLLNNHRRHTTSNIVTDGTVCTDLNAIPSAAIEKIEILRDGASAQYGSDAIAGVVNLQLKRSTGKTFINLHLGQYYKGDGETVLLEINRGFQLNKKGFLNLTASFNSNSPTQRNGIYDSTVYYNIPAGASKKEKDSIVALDNQKVAERGFDRYNFRRIGNYEFSTTSVVVNGGYPVNKKTDLYWAGTMNHRIAHDHTTPVYRYPKDTTTVITELYPDGFQSHILDRSADYSLIAGIEGNTNDNWYWEVSSVYGGSFSEATVSNNNNASQFALGENAQTSFKNGRRNFIQNTNNISFTKNFAKHFQEIKSFTTSFGGEFRIEHHSVKAGEEASYKNYDTTSYRLGGSQPPGAFPENEVDENRYVTSVYAELEMDKNEKFLWNLAGRYEHYSDYGSNLAGKLALRYKFSDRFLLRGSFSNGFRAPAIQQRYFSATNYSGGRNFIGISYIVTFRNDSKEARAFGVSSLGAEKSLNASLGSTIKISRYINLTFDAYWIQVANRIILTGNITKRQTVPRVGQILDSLGRPEVMGVRFYTNSISTRTNGFDIVLTGRWPVRKSMLEISLAGNYNKTNIYKITDPAKNLPDDPVYTFTLINPEERGRIEQSNPLAKIIGAAKYKTGKWEFIARSIYNGKMAHIFSGALRSRDQFFTPKTISYVQINFSPIKWINISAGANNVFNVYPDKLNHRENTQGGLLIYDANSTQIGYNGGYYFLNMSFNF